MKADVYLNRFEYLRDQALDKVKNILLKILRDINAENNLRVVSSHVFDTAVTLE